MVFKNLLDDRTPDEQATILAGYLPNDPLWDDKNVEASELRKILLGLASQWLDARETVNTVCREYDPATTTQLLSEWETTVGIPDGCFRTTGVSLEKRRQQVLLKLAGINVTTAKQFENIAQILGVSITVEAAKDSYSTTFEMTFPIVLLSESESIFTIIVTVYDITEGFPYTFPLSLSDGIISLLRCLFNKLKPSHTLLYFRST